jgi:hypothetical protein
MEHSYVLRRRNERYIAYRKVGYVVQPPTKERDCMAKYSILVRLQLRKNAKQLETVELPAKEVTVTQTGIRIDAKKGYTLETADDQFFAPACDKISAAFGNSPTTIIDFSDRIFLPPKTRKK